MVGDWLGDRVTRALNRLSAAAAKGAPAGKHEDGGGLRLVKGEDGSGKWVLRMMVHGRRREMGLGAFPAVTLAQARRDAERWRAVIREGRDPIKERERERREARRGGHLLRDVAADAFEARRAELKGDGAAGRWFSPLERHVLPKLGGVPVAELDQTDIRDCLAPIWHEKGETARKAIQRLGLVIQHAAAMGLPVDIQAVAKARALLGRSRHRPQHVPALPWREVPAFYASLSDGTPTHLALRLLILTAVRSHPLRFLQLDQVQGDVWTIPGERQKGRRDRTPDFEVPLSGEALRVIEEAMPFARDGFLFPGAKRGVISDATMSRMMERRGMAARPHGFRSSFRDWCAEMDAAPSEVAEAALGHVTGSAVVRAYLRTNRLDARRAAMERWATHVCASVQR